MSAVRQIIRLPREHLDAVSAYGARATWPCGFTIYDRGGQADGVFIVLRGQIVLRSRLTAGRSFVPWVATAGETFGGEGLEAGGRYVTDARADLESETLHLSGARFSALLREQPSRALTLLKQLMAERTALLEKFTEHAVLTVEQRLIAALLRLAQGRAADATPGAVGPPLPRRLLGELVGATRESISLVLGRLTAEGIVQRDGNGLVITDPQRLAAKLDGTSHVHDLPVHADPDVAHHVLGSPLGEVPLRAPGG